jgi:hypothetical protein
MTIDSKPSRPPLAVAPTEQNATTALSAARTLMAPVVRWLLRNGVQYGSFADALKGVFIAVARQELEASGAKVTDSALSVLSGVHRKDVRTLGDPTADRPFGARGVPLASQVFTRWLTVAPWCSGAGKPLPLPRAGEHDSFEALARQVSTDVHPRTVLDELLRLGLVELQGDHVMPKVQHFVPADGLAELAELFAANVADHIEAAVHNMTVRAPKLLEQSVFAQRLTAQSALQLGERARALWSASFEAMAREARARVEHESGDPAAVTRVRVGVYYYCDPARAPTDGAAGSASGAVGA